MLFHMPARLYFGSGQIVHLTSIIDKDLKAQRPVLVTDNGIVQSGLVERIRAQLPGVQIFDDIEANPKSDTINRIAQKMRLLNPDLVIGLGGGSAIDVAKAIAVTAVEKARIWDIVEGKEITTPPLPMIAVPTTAGTGSEVTQYAVISNPEKKKKEGIGKKEFYPVISIVDPVLTVGMPPGLTAAVGLDALCHAIEGYTTKLTTPATDALAEAAIELAGHSLRKAVFNGNDINARSDMMLASMLAGMAITHADTSLAHVIGEAMGAVFNVHHGLAVSLTLPAVMEYNCFTNIKKFKKIAELLGERTGGISTRDAATLAPYAVRQLIYDLNVPRGLAALGASENNHVLDLCTRPGWDGSNLRSASRDEFTELIKGSLSPEMSYWNYAS